MLSFSCVVFSYEIVRTEVLIGTNRLTGMTKSVKGDLDIAITKRYQTVDNCHFMSINTFAKQD
jgi:hypothetical protein